MSSNVLFDAPGPRARRRHAILSVLGAAIVVGLVYLVVRKLGDAGQLQVEQWKPFVVDRSVWRDYLLPGLLGTFKAAVLSIALAGVFGLLLGVGRLSGIAPIRWASSVVVEFFRAVPVLIMMIASYGLYSRSGVFSPETAPLAGVVTGLTLYNGSVIAELVRSGVHSLPKGQSEAGLSVGLTPAQTLRSIQLPQALTAMLPALIGQFVVILKDSALGYAITYLELLNWSKTLGSAFANVLQAYLVAAVLFIIVNYLLTVLASRVQRRLSRRGRANVVAVGAVVGAVPEASTLGGQGVVNTDGTQGGP
ncbi:amino acid ABC transporter permease [Phycicoccus sp. Root563]|uniref:amino acid ABC transporter permease n=1 Tax=Phycicoccus sp. Root563 TaxID=1736562 RepID=UPI00070346C8|nr:amino acid ABC transporter permease [Phycicoccus sp. Root563]KQZ87483.1 amino acid ABC transporter permease [Phycicoccus sp. Root563]